jgi:hypothetical protein
LRAAIRLARGDLAGAGNDTEIGLEAAGRGKDDQVLSHGLGGRAIVALADGRRDEANALARRLEAFPRLPFPMTFGWPTFADVAWLLRDLGRASAIQPQIDSLPVHSRWNDVAGAIAEGHFVQAAETLADMEDLAGEAYARLRAAEAFLEEVRRPESDAQLARALDFYRAAGAGAYVARGERLLAASA